MRFEIDPFTGEPIFRPDPFFEDPAETDIGELDCDMRPTRSDEIAAYDPGIDTDEEIA